MEEKANISDYISLTILDAILDNYADDYPGICLAINDLNENILVYKNFHPICFNYNRKNKETERLCIQCNTHITEYLKTNDYIEHKCGNGIVDIAFPIKHEGIRIGTFYIGQIFIEDDVTPIDFF